jgi:hypothetical protein
MGEDETADIMSEIIMRMAHDSEYSMDHKRRTPCHLGLSPERADLGGEEARGDSNSKHEGNSVRGYSL